jgi:hypothetical protein
MPIRYFGVFCPNGHFIQRGEYPVATLDEPCSRHLVMTDLTEIQCNQCGSISAYQRSDVAHSNWPDGREPQYPHR